MKPIHNIAQVKLDVNFHPLKEGCNIEAEINSLIWLKQVTFHPLKEGCNIEALIKKISK